MTAGRGGAPPQFPAEVDHAGRFVRQDSAFRGAIDARGEHPPARGRYHLYVSLACPWAHRVVIARVLKGLTGVVGMTVVDPVRDERGWAFTTARGGQGDPVNGFGLLEEAYLATDPGFTGRVTVPVLWDRRARCIVSNESEDILRMLDTAFGHMARPAPVLRPATIADEIDEVNGIVYPMLNDGVYRAGFACRQAAYDQAVADVHAGLARVEEILRESRWLVANTFTEADIRLFTTLVRFDPVYHTHFKCNTRRIQDSPPLLGFLRDMAQVPGVMDTIAMDHIKRHYYLTHHALNPGGIVPASDGPDLGMPHGRAALGPDVPCAPG